MTPTRCRVPDGHPGLLATTVRDTRRRVRRRASLIVLKVGAFTRWWPLGRGYSPKGGLES